MAQPVNASDTAKLVANNLNFIVVPF